MTSEEENEHARMTAECNATLVTLARELLEPIMETMQRTKSGDDPWPMVHIYDTERRQWCVIFPGFAKTRSADDRSELMRQLGRFVVAAKGIKPVFMVLSCMAWTLGLEKGQEELKLEDMPLPSDSPDRVECLTINASSVTAMEVLTAIKTNRPPWNTSQEDMHYPPASEVEVGNLTTLSLKYNLPARGFWLGVGEAMVWGKRPTGLLDMTMAQIGVQP